MWKPSVICHEAANESLSEMAEYVYQRTCRTNFDEPGFCLMNLGADLDSLTFRHQILALKDRLAWIHEAITERTLVFISAARFDQQSTTKLHLDGGPEENFLMLGYEPSAIHAELALADYSRCAHDLGLTPMEFLEKHNPMFRAGAELIDPYVTRIPCFSQSNYQILCINNSSAPFDSVSWQGVLHSAIIPEPNDAERRVINSTMIGPAEPGSPELVDAKDLRDFTISSIVRRRGYDA
jgi:hypothetical protein